MTRPSGDVTAACFVVGRRIFEATVPGSAGRDGPQFPDSRVLWVERGRRVAERYLTHKPLSSSSM
jgi:hypothetical protein